MKVWLKLAVIASLLWLSSGCRSPAAAVGFRNSKYFGLWYEVGKFETGGWSFFYKNCACTQTEIRPKTGQIGNATANHSCRMGSPRGMLLSKTGTLKREGPPGSWRESFSMLTRSIEYTVVYMDDNVALEYDCETFLGITNYCVHVLSRNPTMDKETEDLLMKIVDELNLNNKNIPYRKTVQTGCPL